MYDPFMTEHLHEWPVHFRPVH